MSPSEVHQLLELLMDVRDRSVRTEEQILNIRATLADGAARMDDHSSKFPNIRDRLDALERINADSKRRWDNLSAPVKFILFLVLSLATTAIWTLAYEFVSSKVKHPTTQAAP